MLKRCERCGATANYRPRERRCKKLRGAMRCWGRLVRVQQRKESRVAHAGRKRPQDVALKRLEQARRKVAEKTRDMTLLARSLAAWQRRAAYYAKRASMTDEEVRAESERAKAAAAKGRARRTRRGIDLTGGEL